MSKKRILVVDDEKNMQAVLKLLFDGEGYDTQCVSDGVEALELLQSSNRAHRGTDGSSSENKEGFGAVVSDFKMNRLDGMGLLKAMRERDIRVPFVLITAYGTIEKAVEAMKLGAVDVVTKPFAKEALLAVVARSFTLVVGEESWGKDLAEAEGLVYRSPAMAEIGRLLDRVGPATAPVLLTGESGTGKEVLARAIHRAYAGGKFDSKPFVSVNCPAVPESLLESELFGYRKGAFTGADQDFRGKVELADGGSLFFDEIGDLPASIQPKLLRLLENRTFEALGSGKTRDVDIRIICATNRKLDRLVSEGRFREDLFYRINTFTIEMPPLRDRHEDIIPLSDFFLRRFAFEARKGVVAFSPKAAEYITSYSWPGNVRELKNVIERAVILCSGTEILEDDLPRELRRACEESETIAAGGAISTPTSPAFNLAPSANSIESAERSLILDALDRSSGNITAAARLLGLTRNTLRYRVRKYRLENYRGVGGSESV
ncbi:MAG: sigma-54 dependent transcriptional regulator [Rectinemataceae bacterium]|jgi:DNA-binding NtrC family response regulator